MSTLFVEADEPLLIFPSIESAEAYLEAQDVRNGAYPRAFGPSGEQFSVGTEGERIVFRAMDAPADVGGLKALLTRHLEAVGEPVSDAADLPELIAAAEAFWDERDPAGDRFAMPFPWWGCLLIVVGLAAMVAPIWR